MCGPCCYYKSGLIITPQALSIFAFLISFGWGWPWLMGLVVMIIQQVLYCTKVPKALIWVLVFISLIPAALNFYAGYAIMNTVTPGFCWPFFSIELQCNDGRRTVGILSYVSGVLWVICGVLDLVYVLLFGDDDEGEEDEAVAAVAVKVSEDV